jgi:preprotein translocase subunit SecG
MKKLTIVSALCVMLCACGTMGTTVSAGSTGNILGSVLGAITGGGLNVFAKKQERGSEKIVTMLTFGFAVVYLFLSLLLHVLAAE